MFKFNMINSIKTQIGLALLLLVMAMTSCGTAHQYGDRSEKYSRSRRPGYSRPQPSQEEDVVKVKTVNPEKTKAPSGIKSAGTLRNAMVEEAYQYLGTPYKYAGKNPEQGFDCSGFANYIYNKFGFSISGPSHELALLGVEKDRSQLQAGDLLFFGNEERISHVGIVVSGNSDQLTFIHSSTSAGIRTDVVNGSEYWEKRYLFGRDLISGFIAAK